MSAEQLSAPVTVNELIAGMTDFLSSVWAGYTGYAEACPEPAGDRSVDRSPFYVVTASRGSYGVDSASVTMRILLQVRTSQTDGTDQTWAVRTLRDRIDELGQALYVPPNGILLGALPGEMTWEIPDVQPRPVWQAAITISWSLRSATRQNDGFLI